MAYDFTVNIKGTEEVIKKLNTLTDKLQDSAGKTAARKAMRVVRDDARLQIKTHDISATPEMIWKNVYLQQSRRGSKKVDGVMMRVGIIGGALRMDKPSQHASGPGGDTRYWRHVELGTEHSRAFPFLKPALERNAGLVAQTLVNELNIALDKIIGNSPQASSQTTGNSGSSFRLPGVP